MVSSRTFCDWRYLRVRRIHAPGRSTVWAIRLGDHSRIEAQINLRVAERFHV